MRGVAEGENRFPEVGTALAVLATLVLIELLLFEPTRVQDDAADLVGLCGFGGLAAVALRTTWKGLAGRIAASTPLGVVAGLTVLHGGRPSGGSGISGGLVFDALDGLKVLDASQWHWKVSDVFLIALVVAVIATLAAWLVQGIIDHAQTLLGFAVPILFAAVVAALAALAGTGVIFGIGKVTGTNLWGGLVGAIIVFALPSIVSAYRRSQQ
jgi:hypothetical protein